MGARHLVSTILCAAFVASVAGASASARISHQAASVVPARGVLLGASVAGASASARTSHQAASVVPAHGVLLGAYVDDTGRWVDDATAEAGVSRFEAELGRRLAIDHHYYAWTDSFPTGLERWDLAGGRIPMISWGGTRLQRILSGSYDAMIRERARAVRALGAPVFIRFGWEMNGNWSPDDGTHNNDPGTTDGPRKYVAAWRHIHDLFRQEGATNAVWVWSPNATDVPARPWNRAARYYPGDAYVDWVGIDAYNWGTFRSWSSWTPLAKMVRPLYDAYAGRKPIMIAETASAEQGGSKAAWLNAARSALRSRFPRVAAFVYFETDKETDWSVDSSPGALRAFRSLASDPYFDRLPVRELTSAAGAGEAQGRAAGPSVRGPVAGIR